MCRDFERFVEARSPRLAPLAKALMREFTKSEYSRSSGVSTSSVSRQADKLKALVEEFLESMKDDVSGNEVRYIPLYMIGSMESLLAD